MMKSKRGSMQDALFLMLFGILMAITFVSMYMVISKYNDAFQATDNIAAEGKALVQSSKDQYVGLMDGVYLVILVAAWLGSLILASQINSSPIFFFASFAVYIIIVVVSAILGNTYSAFAEASEVAAYASDFTIIPIVMNNFAVVMLFMGFTIGIVMYMRMREG